MKIEALGVRPWIKLWNVTPLTWCIVLYCIIKSTLKCRFWLCSLLCPNFIRFNALFPQYDINYHWRIQGTRYRSTWPALSAKRCHGTLIRCWYGTVWNISVPGKGIFHGKGILPGEDNILNSDLIPSGYMPCRSIHVMPLSIVAGLFKFQLLTYRPTYLFISIFLVSFQEMPSCGIIVDRYCLTETNTP